MDVVSDVAADSDTPVAGIAAAIGEPARARMLYSLMDGRARTATELAAVADVTPSTASLHLARLRSARLVRVEAQGKHRYFRLDGPDVAAALEGLRVLAGGRPGRFVPTAPPRLRAARTCYDHIAGTVGVGLRDRLEALGWLAAKGGARDDLTPDGARSLEKLGVDVAAARGQRRRFACPCLDWSERRAHVGGALGAALLDLALRKRWVARDLDSRALTVTPIGRRELRANFGLRIG
ncbi:MAG TPA: helix-turn-helix transcriptional regulator [Thermoanaerobaculia bacterium]